MPMTYGSKTHLLRQRTVPVQSNKNIFLNTIDDTQIPTTRISYTSANSDRRNASGSQRSTKPFLRGPISMDWLSAAAQQPGKALNVAIAILWLYGMNSCKPVKVTSHAIKLMNISADAFTDGLKRLEGAGLVQVTRSPGCRPTVDVCPV